MMAPLPKLVVLNDRVKLHFAKVIYIYIYKHMSIDVKYHTAL
jgi:hypothetical protein